MEEHSDLGFLLGPARRSHGQQPRLLDADDATADLHEEHPALQNTGGTSRGRRLISGIHGHLMHSNFPKKT